LHLQGNDDALNVATHLFTPASLILARLEKLSPQNGEDIEEGLAHRWASDIQRFLQKNLVSPARSAFTNHQDDSVLTTALEVSQGQAENSAPCLYFLAVADFKMSARHGLRKSNLDWMKKVFQAVETVIRRRQDRNQLMKIILEQAVHQSVAVNVDDLRRVAQDYALSSDTTDWLLLARLGECDPEVFHTSEEAGELLDELCKRSVANSITSDLASVSQVLGAIMQGYRTGRDFSGFLKLWFGQMRRAIQQGNDTKNPWLSVAHLKSQQESFEGLIEKELLPTQLVEVMHWAAQQDADATSDCIFAEAIVRGVRSEPFIDALGRDLFDLIWRTNGSSSPRTALRWRVVSKTMSWISPQERSALWETIRPRITGVLEKSPVKSWETFEAFKCCSQIWISMSPDDDNIKVVASATEAFLLRLTKEITASKALRRDVELMKPGEDVDKAEFSEETAFENYLLYFLRGCSRLGRFVFAQQERPALPLAQALETRKTEVPALKKRWDAIFENEVGLNTVGLTNQALTLLLDTFEAADLEKRWPSAQAQMCMRVLSRVPLDTFDREQRERAMKVLNKGFKRMLQSVKKSELNSWKLVFSLATKLLSRPTFYEDMSFKDVSDVADGMSSLSFDISTSSGTALEMIERFSLLARTSFRQMAEHVDERSIRYFTEALPFISESHKLAATAEDDKANSTPVRITLLKALVTEMSQSPSCRNRTELSKVLQSAQEALSACIVHTVSILLSEKKVFKHRDTIIDLGLFAVVDASGTLENLSGLSKHKQSTIRKLDKRSREAMEEGDARGWAVQTFLRTHLSSELEMSCPTKIGSLVDLPTELRTRLLKDYVDSIVRSMDHNERLGYLQGLISEFKRGCDTDGQALAIYHVTTQLLGIFKPSFPMQGMTNVK
jgi:nucleolar pre-ribosomal-associated protein 2